MQGLWILDKRKFFTRAEQKHLRQKVLQQRDALGTRMTWQAWFLIELAFESGLRVSEMASLNCDDLYIYDPPGVRVLAGKGGKPRFVRVRRAFIQSVETYFRWKRLSGELVAPHSPVFRSPVHGGHVSVRCLQQAFERACDAAGITGHSIHHCRHTYASELYFASGKDLRFVQKQLGHSRITTTQVYADVFDDHAATSLERLYAEKE